MDQIPLIEGVFNDIVTRFSKSDILYYAEFPVQRHYIKKNNRPLFVMGKRAVMGKSPEIKQAEKYLTLQFKSAANKCGLEYPIEIPVWAIFLFFINKNDFFTKEGNISKIRPDLSNMYELPQDCLESAGVLKNDNLICSHDLSRRLPSEETKLIVYLLRHQFDFLPQGAIDA